MKISPEHRLHSYVTAATIMVMFYFIQHIVPLLTFSPGIDKLLKPGVSLLASVGVYKLFAGLLLSTSRRWKPLKRWFLGPRYLNGTWVGMFRAADGSCIYTVEHFEQSLSSLQIRGEAFLETGETYAEWRSVSETIAEDAGLVTYTYTCDKDSEKGSFQGVCVFNFVRPDERSITTEMKGYSADLTDGERTRNRERKISENLLAFAQALLEAKKA
jgi:hypothetical protein